MRTPNVVYPSVVFAKRVCIAEVTGHLILTLAAKNTLHAVAFEMQRSVSCCCCCRHGDLSEGWKAKLYLEEPRAYVGAAQSGFSEAGVYGGRKERGCVVRTSTAMKGVSIVAVAVLKNTEKAEQGKGAYVKCAM